MVVVVFVVFDRMRASKNKKTRNRQCERDNQKPIVKQNMP